MLTYEKNIKNDKNFKNRNIIYYVSEMEVLPSYGHFRKLDAGNEVINQISNVVKKLEVNKYSSYEGEVINAGSVGIVFPSYMWGASLAVQGFLKNLKVNENTYLYVIVAGDKYELSNEREIINNLQVTRVKRMLANAGAKVEVFVRCIDGIRNVKTDSECRKLKDIKEKINLILESVQYYKEDKLTRLVEEYKMIQMKKAKAKEIYHEMRDMSEYEKNTSNSDIKLTNIYLEDSVLEGVRLCQAV